MEDYISKAARQNVDLIVFPECAVQGIVIDKSLLDNKKEYRDHFAQLAKRYQVDIVPGSFAELDPTDGNRYNVSYYIDKDGQVLIEYRKVHLWHPEKPSTTAGQEFPTAMTRFGFKVGLLLCWDIAFHDGFANMALDQGAQLILAPAYWSYEDAGEEGLKRDRMCEVTFVNGVSTCRAFEFEICFVFANGANDVVMSPEDGPDKLMGRTQISTPFLGTIQRCDHDVEDMLVTDLDVAETSDASEKSYQIRKAWAARNGYNLFIHFDR
ncbi:carbon-nitrogen hydrolase [Hesseltinella vesiculosa]|uniref:Carbon-nitrogen hydrolase n=1 Tax=Hesseltinella vesiculosa TaxID=101127 RepID=A0A1X2GYU8_9FUNG|nr:carbon-nitrogen hydrolase [Hesseltinella vesiculosa]